MAVDTQYAIETLVFTVHNNELRNSRIKRIVIDAAGQAYILQIDGHLVEKGLKEIAKTKEDLFNNLVDRFTARQTK